MFFCLSQSEILRFTKQMSLILDYDINIIDALDIIILQSDEVNKDVYISIKKNILDGHSLSYALNKYNLYFGNTYINTVKSGETAGTLNKSFGRLYHFLNQKQNVKAQIFEALIYPVFVLSISVIMLYLIFKYFIPQILCIFVENNIKIPIALNSIVSFINIINEYKVRLIMFGIMLIGVLKFYISTKKGKYTLHKYLLRIPVIGNAIHFSNLLEFITTMEILFKNNIPLHTCLSISKKVLDNVFIKNKIDTLYSAIKNGSCLSVEMKRLCPEIFPLIIVQIISIGEKTGDLSPALQFASLHITNEINQKNKIFIKLLGPILIVFISCLIGLIMLVTIVPLFEIYTKII